MDIELLEYSKRILVPYYRVNDSKSMPTAELRLHRAQIGRRKSKCGSGASLTHPPPLLPDVCFSARACRVKG